MAFLSDDEFVSIFGDAMQKKEQPRVDPYVTPVRRILDGDAGWMDYVDAAIDVAASAPGMVNKILEIGGPDQATPIELANPSRTLQNLRASVPAVVAAIPATADLVTKGVPAVVEGALTDKTVADSFMERVLTPESMAMLADRQTDALEQFAMNNPQATQKDIAAFHKEYLASDDFYDAVVSALPAGLESATRIQQFANDVGNLGLRPDQMSAGDEASQIVGGAFVGLPGSMVEGLTRPIVSAIGQRVAKSIPARVAARTIEAVTPLTLPLTPGNIAMNAGVGVALNEGIRGLSGEDTLIDYANVYNPDKIDVLNEVSPSLGIGAGILFGLPAVNKQLADEAVKQAERAVKFVGQSAGDTLAEQADALEPTITRARGLTDSNAPVKAAAQKFGADMDDVQQLDAAMSSASSANRVETVNNTLNYGILEGMDNTVPFTKIEESFNQLDDLGKDMLDKYVYAVQRQSNERIYEKSLIEQVDQARNKLIIANTSGNRGRINAASKEYTELQARYQQLQQDDPSTRSLMRDWTRDQVNAYIKAGEANEATKAIGDAMRKISTDLVGYMQKNGVIDAETAAKWRGNRDLHVKVQERDHAKASGLKRRALLFKDKFKFQEADSDQPFFVNTASRNVSGEGAVVNNPLPAIAALKESIIDTVRSVAANNARKDVVDRLNVLPDATDRLLRPYKFNLGNGREVTSISPAQYNTLYPKGIKNEDDYVKVLRNGKIELWEFADPAVTKSLQFAPIASVPILNATRKIYQQMTTGVGAPWFAARAFLWDAPIAQTTKNAGRSLGLMDTFARRLVQGTMLERPVGGLMDRMFDPTIFAATALAIPQQIGLRAAKALGDKIASDLAQSSGLFGAIASTGPMGQEVLRRVGYTMAQSFDQSALAVMSRNMSTSMSHLNDVSKIRNDYAKAASKWTGPVRAVLDSYKAMLDSVHMSTRYAFFANNYGLLKAKYGNDIPKSEIKKLVQETRNLTGDMSRQSLNKTIQKATSVIPYSNAMIQGTRHILSSAVPSYVREGINVAGGNIIRDKDTRFWSQFLSGVALPTIGALSFLSNWEGAEDYWYNKTPKWKQMSGIPIPSPEVVIEYMQTGKLPEFHPDKLNVVPIAPEMSMFLYPAVQGARALGLLGKAPHSTPQPFGQQVKDVMDQVTSFATPPLLQAFAAMSGQRLDLHGLLTSGQGLSAIQNQGSGANADMMTTDSFIPQAVYDTLGALFSSGAQIAMQTLNVADISYQESDSFAEAAAQALDTAKFEVGKRMPEISTGMWDARQKAYAFTPESEYVYKSERQLEPIIGPDRQLTIERDSKNRVELSEELGLAAPNKISDPNLRTISAIIWDMMRKKGPYKEATDGYSRVRSLLKDLENSRAKMPDNRYGEMRNRLIRKQQEFMRIKSQVLQKVEQQLIKQVGPQFEQQYGQPFSYENLSNAVRKDVAGK